MTVTGQASLHAWVATQEHEKRLTTRPLMFVKQVGRTAADLLSQMLWWVDRTGGKFYHTHRDWMDELAMSEHEVKTSLKKLERMGIVRISVGREPKDKLKKTTWYEVVIEKICHWWKSPLANGENHLYAPAKITVSYIKKKEGKEEGEEEQALCAKSEPGVTGKGNSKEDGVMVRPSVKGKVQSSADQVLKNLQAQKKKKLEVPTGADRVKQLVAWWKDALPEYTSVTFVKEPTGTEYGMFKHFMNTCLSNDIDAAEVLACAVKDWVEFATFVKVRQGLKIVPTVPTIRFLLSYVQDAVDFWRAETKLKVSHTVAKATSPQVQLTALPPINQPKPIADVATMEDLLELQKIFGKK